MVHNIVDINNRKKLNAIVKDFKPEIVFHLAAQSLVRKGYQEPILTWETNLIGSLNLLEALRQIDSNCAVIIVTTDKVYENKEEKYGYIESDKLGGYDPYSASKAATEIAITSWRRSFCGLKGKNNIHCYCKSWKCNWRRRLGKRQNIPDAIKALIDKKPILFRNPLSETLATCFRAIVWIYETCELLYKNEDLNIKKQFSQSFNFSPNEDSNKNVSNLVNEILKY